METKCGERKEDQDLGQGGMNSVHDETSSNVSIVDKWKARLESMIESLGPKSQHKEPTQPSDASEAGEGEHGGGRTRGMLNVMERLRVRRGSVTDKLQKSCRRL